MLLPLIDQGCTTMSSRHVTGRAPRLKNKSKLQKKDAQNYGEMAEALERRVLLASVATITNGIIGDNGLVITVDAYGSYGRAYVNNTDPGTLASDTVYDPPGPGTNLGTTRMSGLYLGGPVGRFLTSNNTMDSNALAPGFISNASPDTAVSSFSVGA